MRVPNLLVLALSAASRASAFVQQPTSSVALPAKPITTALAALQKNDSHGTMRKVGEAILAAMLFLGVTPNAGQAIEYRLPPIDRSDASRCTIKSSSMGQSNAQRDKLFDLRECKLEGANAQGFDLSGVIM